MKYSDLYKEYESLWADMQIRPEHLAKVRTRAADILLPRRRQRYEAVQNRTEIPWMVIACIHSMEANLSFDGHLHNGDPLSARTVRVPAGRPRIGAPIFSWEESAEDALEMKQTSEIIGWSIPECLYFFEHYNGWGYRNGKGRNTTPECRSPYLWSFTNHYEKGKYIRDHVFDDDAVSRQMGAAALLYALVEMAAQHPVDTVGARNPTDHDKPILRIGSRGEEVAELQKILRDAGFLSDVVDGIYGGNTKNAVQEFQRNKSINVDGVVGPQTWDLLLSPLSPHDNTEPVMVLSNLRQGIVTFATNEAKKGRKHAPGNEIDRLILDPLRPILKQLGHLGKNQNDSFFNWCAAWVTYICRNNDIKIPDRYKNYWASSAKVEAWRHMAIDLDAWSLAGQCIPLAGDIVVYNWDDDSDVDHIGILKEIHFKNNQLIACEGNKNNQETIATRSLSSVEGFIDIEKLSRALNGEST